MCRSTNIALNIKKVTHVKQNYTVNGRLFGIVCKPDFR